MIRGMSQTSYEYENQYNEVGLKFKTNMRIHERIYPRNVLSNNQDEYFHSSKLQEVGGFLRLFLIGFWNMTQ